MIQGSEEWFAARLGKVTASKVADVMAKTKSGYGAARHNYMAELISQRLTGKREEGFTNAAMQRGTEMEPIARGCYEATQGVMVIECGLIDHPEIKGFAASPDGLIDDDGCLEIKCPNTNTHLKFIESGKPDKKYIWQMMAQMECAEREWCDFVSYDDRVGEGLEFELLRIERDDDMIMDMREEIISFIEELENRVGELTELRKKRLGDVDE